MVTSRKLIVEVVDAHNLMPKDGHGFSSPFVVVKFGSQCKRTETKVRDLNPVWNETLSFDVGTPTGIPRDVLKVKVMHDMKHGPIRRSSTLGRIRLNSRSFAKKGDEALIYHTLNRGIFKNVKGEIGLKVYYVNEELPRPQESVTVPPAEPEIVEEPPQGGNRPDHVPPEAETSVEPKPKAVPAPTTVARTDQENLAPPGTSISSYVFELWRRLPTRSSIFAYVFELWRRLLLELWRRLPSRSAISSYVFELWRRLPTRSSIFSYVLYLWKRLRSNGARREARLV